MAWLAVCRPGILQTEAGYVVHGTAQRIGGAQITTCAQITTQLQVGAGVAIATDVGEHADAVGCRQRIDVDTWRVIVIDLADTDADERVDALLAVEHPLGCDSETLNRVIDVARGVVLRCEHRQLAIPFFAEHMAQAECEADVVVRAARVVDPQAIDLWGNVPAANVRPRRGDAARGCGQAGCAYHSEDFLHRGLPSSVAGARRIPAKTI